MPFIFEFLSLDMTRQHRQGRMKLLERLDAGHLVGAHHMRPLRSKHGGRFIDLTDSADLFGQFARDHRGEESTSSACDGAAKRSPFKNRSTVRGEIRSTMPRLTASSASSRGVQVLIGRPAASGFSHGSRHDLHELLRSVKVAGAPGRCASVKRTSMACKRDSAARQRSRERSHRFIIHVLVLGYLRIARSLECFQDDLSSLDQSLCTRGTSYHVLKDVELQGTDMDWGSLRLWHRMLLLRIAFPLITIIPYPPALLPRGCTSLLEEIDLPLWNLVKLII
jgi:hypothetical protein